MKHLNTNCVSIILTKQPPKKKSQEETHWNHRKLWYQKYQNHQKLAWKQHPSFNLIQLSLSPALPQVDHADPAQDRPQVRYRAGHVTGANDATEMGGAHGILQATGGGHKARWKQSACQAMARSNYGHDEAMLKICYRLVMKNSCPTNFRWFILIYDEFPTKCLDFPLQFFLISGEGRAKMHIFTINDWNPPKIASHAGTQSHDS